MENRMTPPVAVTRVKHGYAPTRKWLAAQVVALGGLAASWVASGWDDTETKLLVAIAVQAATTYLVPNLSAPGGVPDAKVVREEAKR